MPAKINTAALELLTRAAKQFKETSPVLTSNGWINPSNWTDEDWELLNTSIWMAEQTLEKEDNKDASVDSK